MKEINLMISQRKIRIIHNLKFKILIRLIRVITHSLTVINYISPQKILHKKILKIVNTHE